MAGRHHSSSHHSGSHHSSHSSSHSSSRSSSHHSYSSHHHGSSYHGGHGSYKSGEVSPYSSLPRDEVQDYEEFKNANSQYFVDSFEKENNAGNPLPQMVEAVQQPDEPINTSNEGIVMHATMKTDATGNKIKIDSPNVPYRNFGINDAYIYGRSWVIDDAYAMDTNDTYFQQNYKGNKKTADPGTRLAIIIVFMAICLFLSFVNFFYELLIGIFENMDMPDVAFNVVDDFIFYGQFFFPFVVIFAEYHRFKKKHKKNLMFTAQMIKYHLVEEEKNRFEMTHEFLPVCPSCGAARQGTDMYCMYCGARLLRSSEDIQ